MIKQGVVSRGPFADMALRREREKRGWWPFAYTLLGDIEQSYTARDDALLERIYASMRAGDGVFKITRERRFTALDGVLADEIAGRLRSQPQIRVHDMAASNAITSLELFRALAADPRVRVQASDFFDCMHVLSFADTSWRVVLDIEMRPLQLVGPHMVLSAYRSEPLRYPVNRLLQSLVGRRLLARVDSEALRRGTRPAGASLERIGLFHPVAVYAARQEPRFTLGRDNLFAPAGGPFEIVRVMNALTSRHFEEARVIEGVRAVAATLVEGGLLALGRNIDEEDGRLRATVYEKLSGQLHALKDIGEGYELATAVGGLAVG
jgi:hypothetical protein